MNRTTVYLFRREGRKNYECQWTDPVTGQVKTRTAKTPIKRDAERFRTRLEDELNAGEFVDAGRLTWAEFREKFENQYAEGRARKTQEVYGTAFNHVERLIRPKLLAAVDAGQISKMVAALREAKLGEVSIKTYLTHLRTALRWAKRQKLLRAVPSLEIPKVRARMKGRPITAEEFERMLAKVADVVGDETADRWRWCLRGLWWSGLRLGEAAELSWDADAPIRVDLSGEFPMLSIEAEAEKGRQDRPHYPVAPEFAEMLRSIPADERHGYVLRPPRNAWRWNHKGPIGAEYVGSVIAEIGRSAGVKVSDKGGKVKFASAHDLRRAFGHRWSQRVMPAVLQILMRHNDIKTTMSYYVGRDAEATAKAVWQAFSNVPSNTRPEAGREARNGSAEDPTGISGYVDRF